MESSLPLLIILNTLLRVTFGQEKQLSGEMQLKQLSDLRQDNSRV